MEEVEGVKKGGKGKESRYELLWSRAMVVSVKEKAGQRPCQVKIREASGSELLLRCRNE